MALSGRWGIVMLVVITACGGDTAASDAASGGAPADAASSPPARPPVDPRVRELAAGRALYEENCLLCHGLRGEGDGTGAAGLAVKPTNIREHFGEHSFDEIVEHVVAGVPPAMPAAAIHEEEVKLVLSYIWSTIPDSAQARLRALQEQAAEEH
ncbi:MAG: cytochrome c [Gemmatimonadetes bacterium]|nr:cytochrome c [Gemmatimonadota bacterium]